MKGHIVFVSCVYRVDDSEALKETGFYNDKVIRRIKVAACRGNVDERAGQ